MELYVHVQNMLTNASEDLSDVRVFWVERMPFGFNDPLRKHWIVFIFRRCSSCKVILSTGAVRKPSRNAHSLKINT